MSEASVIWTVPAIVDVKEAWDFIAADDEAAADRTIHRLEEAARALARFPKLGRPWKKRNQRQFAVAGTQYWLFYRIRREAIEILRVMHGARDWPPKR